MKKVIVLALAISLVVAGIALATVVSTKHDMRMGVAGIAGRTITAAGSTTTQVCVFCHHPHRGTSTVTTTLLWNISDAATTYPTYGPTATTNAITMGDNLGTTGSASYSVLCMSCHDGGAANSTFIKSQAADGTLGSFPNLGLSIGNLTSDLQDDHPVDFTYEGAVESDSDIRAATSGGPTSSYVAGANSVRYPLYGGTLQCATCHDVHNGQSPRVQFMRGGTTNIITNSQICIDCHMSK